MTARQESKHGWSLTSVWKSLKGETDMARRVQHRKAVATGGVLKVPTGRYSYCCFTGDIFDRKLASIRQFFQSRCQALEG